MEMYKSTTTEKVAYYCEQNGEWNGPRDTTKPKEKETKEKKTMMPNERQKGERGKRVEVEEAHPHPTHESGEGMKREREETSGNKSEYLLWTLRFDADDWLMGGEMERLLPTGGSGKYPTSARGGNRGGRRMANCSERHQKIRSSGSIRKESSESKI